MVCFEKAVLLSWLGFSVSAYAWITPAVRPRSFQDRSIHIELKSSMSSAHGENACFLPLKQLGQDDHSPRIIQIAGAYPGLTKEDFMAVSSEPAPDCGQWTYDFSDPDGPQLGTVALEGSEIVSRVQDPVVVITDHFTMGIELPKAIKDPVDLVVLVDRAEREFAERKFYVVDTGSEGLAIKAFSLQTDIPDGTELLGRVEVVQIPWLPGMAPTKTGFAEADEYFMA